MRTHKITGSPPTRGRQAWKIPSLSEPHCLLGGSFFYCSNSALITVVVVGAWHWQNVRHILILNAITPDLKKILVVLPSPLMARNFLRTEILHLLGAGVRAQVTVVSPDPEDRVLIEMHGADWRPFFHPRRFREPGKIANLLRRGRYLRYLAGLFFHMCLTFRINTISGFNGFAVRLRQSFALRKAYLREGLPMSPIFGFPFPRSTAIYKFLYRLYYSRWQGFGPVEKLVEELQPDIMILSMIQTHMMTPYLLAARHQGVRILGINGSWDQPTTKGPVCPGIERIVVQNDVVRDQLVRYHHVPQEKITTIGWLQMDSYPYEQGETRQALFAHMGIPFSHRYILFAANAPRLGLHEPEVFRALALQMQAGVFGQDVTLVCRCHPQDRNWQARWGWAMDMPFVVVEPPDLGPLDHLAALIRHAGVVIASAGSINLDAVALDTPTIGLAWEDENLAFQDRPARAYDLDHLSELRKSSGMMFARNEEELLAACARYLADRAADTSGRTELRDRYLFRIDGKAANRFVAEVERMLA